MFRLYIVQSPVVNCCNTAYFVAKKKEGLEIEVEVTALQLQCWRFCANYALSLSALSSFNG